MQSSRSATHISSLWYLFTEKEQQDNQKKLRDDCDCLRWKLLYSQLLKDIFWGNPFVIMVKDFYFWVNNCLLCLHSKRVLYVPFLIQFGSVCFHFPQYNQTAVLYLTIKLKRRTQQTSHSSSLAWIGLTTRKCKNKDRSYKRLAFSSSWLWLMFVLVLANKAWDKVIHANITCLFSTILLSGLRKDFIRRQNPVKYSTIYRVL